MKYNPNKYEKFVIFIFIGILRLANSIVKAGLLALLNPTILVLCLFISLCLYLIFFARSAYLDSLNFCKIGFKLRKIKEDSINLSRI